MTEEQVFLAAVELTDPAERIAYLNKVCGKDMQFRRNVEELLAAHFKSGLFLDEPVGTQMAADSGPPSDDTISIQANHGDIVPDQNKTEEETDDLAFLQPSTRPDSLGRIDHYEVLEVLGKGGFGIVLRAFDETLQRVVALKVMSPSIAATSPARKRFLREARSSAQVRHEHVVQVHAVGEQPLPYLVMEFIPGETLQKRLDRIGPLETPEIVRIGRQIAEGLAAAHAQDLIHRDIKPGNVLLEGGQLRVKITDFGLARAADDASLTQSGVLSGTPMYMSPEQAQGESIDYRADLFSLGSVMYVMASGRPPFRASTTFGVLKRVAEETPRPIREVIPEVPVWLCEIIGKLQAKKPAERFQSAREVADILADCEAKLKGEAKTKDFYRVPQSKPTIPQSTPKPAAAKSGKWKWLAAAVLLVPILTLAVTEITGVTHLFRDPSPSPGPGPIVKGDPSKKSDPPDKALDPQKKSEQPDKAATDVAAWERSVAGLPADEQVKAVSARLQHLNPGFDGKVDPTFENDVVTGLQFLTDQVSDISPVHALTRLKSLVCFASAVDQGQLSAQALLPLRGLPLTNLHCFDSRAVSDLSPLKEMKLTSLNLRELNVGDADVKNLAGQKDLQTLCLWGSKVTDAGVKHLAGLKNLQNLCLQNTPVTDVGLKELTGLDKLESLDLYAVPRLTDAGLEELAKLKALKHVDLRGTNVTDTGVDKLAAALPALRITAPKGVIEPRGAWNVLKPNEMKSEGGAELKLLDDRSVLVSGNHPDKDVYTLTFRELPGKIHSLRLEALTNDALPNKGPGRHANAEFIFVLSTIKAELVPAKGAPLSLKFASAWADYDAEMSRASHALDAEDNTGWSAPTGESHYAVFEMENAVAVPEGAVLRVTLEFKHEDAQRELGCFRLSAAKGKQPQPTK